MTATLGNAEAQTAFDDLVREFLSTLLPATVGTMWCWCVGVILVASQKTLPIVLFFSIIAGSCWASHSLKERHLDLAVAFYLAGLATLVTAAVVITPSIATLYIYLIVVPIAAVLTSPSVMWIMAAIVLALIIGVGHITHLPFMPNLASPMALVLVTTFTTWLGSRRLFAALGWALSMSEQAQKNAEEARERRAEVRSILKSLEEAYVRLERANQALIFAREAAEKAYRFKTEFVANVSHELRTPLNLIVGFAEMMAMAPESYGGEPLPKQYRGDLMAIYRSARHLSDLIDDVLDLSQIEAGRTPLTREPAALGEIIYEAVEIIRGLVEAKGLRMLVDITSELPILQVDRTRIRQVLLNLLSNATRFTDEGWIRVSAAVVEREVRITVDDSGQGIDPDRIAQAFVAFSQLDDDRARQGTGLGLAVSRKFVEMHGGRMWIESEPGHGTKVGFSLPAGRESVVSTLLTGSPVPASQEARPVILLHDDPRALTLLRRHIEGYEFIRVDTAEHAIAAVQQVLPRAVIVARSLAGPWAEAAAQASLPSTLPVVTCPFPSLRGAGHLLGAVDFLAKPVRREDLLAALARLPESPRSVLIVDDDPNFVRLLMRMLRTLDDSLELRVAPGGAEGLAAVRAERPDLVLLDLWMPGINGYEFLEQVRQDASLSDLAVIILSAYTMDQDAAPLSGALQVERQGGLSLTDMLQMLDSLLNVLTRPAAGGPANAATPAAVAAG